VNDLKAESSSPTTGANNPVAGIALGLGLTNECNLSCAFCYRDPARTDRLSLDQVKSVMERLPVRSVNLGTGENGMHPEFRAILAYLRTKPVKLTITSNGHSVAVLEDNELLAFHDIEFSLDYPTQAEQDAQRGTGNWELIHGQAERCVRLGVPVTIVAVMMKANYLRLADVARVAKRFDAPLRVNVYQAVRSIPRRVPNRRSLPGENCWRSGNVPRGIKRASPPQLLQTSTGGKRVLLPTNCFSRAAPFPRPMLSVTLPSIDFDRIGRQPSQRLHDSRYWRAGRAGFHCHGVSRRADGFVYGYR